MKIALILDPTPDARMAAYDLSQQALLGLSWGLDRASQAALGQALRWQAEVGAHVTAFSVGGDEAENLLQGALRAGVDEALLVRTRGPAQIQGVAAGWQDGLRAAHQVAVALRPGAYAMILLGASAPWGGGYLTGALGELLGLPVLQRITEIHVDWESGSATAHQWAPGGRRRVLACTLPTIVGVDPSLAPRPYIPVLSRRYRTGLRKVIGEVADSLPAASSSPAWVRVSEPRARPRGSARTAGASPRDRLMGLSAPARPQKEIFTGPPDQAADLLWQKLKDWLKV